MRSKLQALHPWFAALMREDGGEARTARYMAHETPVAGVPLRIEEMTGEPGDAWLMHPNILHGGSSNVLDRPRLALSQFVQPKAG